MQYACHRLVSIVILVVIGIFVLTFVGICRHRCQRFSHQCSHPICCNYRYFGIVFRHYVTKIVSVFVTLLLVLSPFCSHLFSLCYRHVTVFVAFFVTAFRHFCIVFCRFLRNYAVHLHRVFQWFLRVCIVFCASRFADFCIFSSRFYRAMHVVQSAVLLS